MSTKGGPVFTLCLPGGATRPLAPLSVTLLSMTSSFSPAFFAKTFRSFDLNRLKNFCHLFAFMKILYD